MFEKIKEKDEILFKKVEATKAIPNDGGLIKNNEMIKHIRLYEKFLKIKEDIDGYRIAHDEMIKKLYY